MAFFLTIVISIVILSFVYSLISICSGLLFRLRQFEVRKCREWPAVVCIKPLCGGEPGLKENLLSFTKLDYPDYKVLIGTASQDDPAYRTALDAAACDPSGRFTVVYGEMGKGANPKVRNLRNILAHVSADAEYLLFSDADVRVGPEYIRRMVSPLCRKPSVGLVTSVYRIEDGAGIGRLIEALAVESVFLPSVLVAGTFSRLKFALGASIAVRKSDLEGIGGLEAIENYLADDYHLGNAIFKKGKHIELSTSVVPIVSRNLDAAETLRQISRWNRTVRICRPVGYGFTVFAFYGFFWSVVAVGIIAGCGGRLPGPLFGLSAETVTAFISVNTLLLLLPAAAYGIRFLSSLAMTWALRTGKSGLLRSFLTPFWDLMGTGLWFAGLLGKRIVWAKKRYRILRDGRLKVIKNRNS